MRNYVSSFLTRENEVTIQADILKNEDVCTVRIADVTLFFKNRDEALLVMGSVVDSLWEISKDNGWLEIIQLDRGGNDE